MIFSSIRATGTFYSGKAPDIRPASTVIRSGHFSSTLTYDSVELPSYWTTPVHRYDRQHGPKELLLHELSSSLVCPALEGFYDFPAAEQQQFPKPYCAARISRADLG